MVMGRRKGDWGGVTFDMKCDSHQGGVKLIRSMSQLMERCDSHGGDVTAFNRYDSPKGGVKDIRKVC